MKTGDIGPPDPKEVTDYIKAKRTNTLETVSAKTGGSGSVVIKDDLLHSISDQFSQGNSGRRLLSDSARKGKKSEVATSALKGSSELAQDSEEQDDPKKTSCETSLRKWNATATISWH